MRNASLDPIRYGLRALDVLARAEASVALPAPTQDAYFDPRRTLQPPSREGAALSLRLFSDEEDCTDFLLRATDAVTFAPVPARASTLFEAHAATRASDGDEEMVVGFPLVAFVQAGMRRTAPLFSFDGVRASWRLGESPWKLPPRAVTGTAIEVPTELRLIASAREPDEAPFSPHTGLWSALFDLDPGVWAELPTRAKNDPGAMVRGATRLLSLAAEDAVDEPLAPGPLTRDDLRALCEAVRVRAQARFSVQCHPHGLAMLLPRGDPTSGLRTELRAMEKERVPARGPLAVFLGAERAPAEPGVMVSCGATAPTPSQVQAAMAFEGARDLVAVCGPPGCGKTTLLHHLAAHAIVSCALDATWVQRPDHAESRWALVITSTNNTAVDHALSPFTRGRAFPVGLRVGNRRSMAESTAATLRDALAALEAPSGPSVPSARAAFEARARAVREARDAHHAAREAQRSAVNQRKSLQGTIDGLTAKLQRPSVPMPAGLTAKTVRIALSTLREHLEGLEHVAPKCLDGPNPSVEKARARWAEANRRRGPKMDEVFAAMAMAIPYGPLPDLQIREEIDRQRTAMEAALDTLEAALDQVKRPAQQQELDGARAKLAALAEAHEPPPPPLDPSLVELALDVRDAWAYSHRARLMPVLREALGLLLQERKPQPGRPLPRVLAALSRVFPVAGCTLLSMRAAFTMEPEVIERLVIDEAGQCAPVYAIPALARARRALCTGDTAQLPPVYTLSDAADDRLGQGLSREAIAPFRMGSSATTSAQAVAALRTEASLSLVEHFRSQPAIVALASRWSGYTLDVRTPARSMEDISPRLSRPVRVEHLRGVGTRAPEGIVNEREADRALVWITTLLADGVRPSDIAVLTPFVGQSARIERALRSHGLAGEGGVLVKTVHKLQGGERRVVLFSVVATEAKHLRWLRERPHLLHVATSRAQDHLVVLMNLDAARDEPVLAPLVELHAATLTAR